MQDEILPGSSSANEHVQLAVLPTIPPKTTAQTQPIHSLQSRKQSNGIHIVLLILLSAKPRTTKNATTKATKAKSNWNIENLDDSIKNSKEDSSIFYRWEGNSIEIEQEAANRQRSSSCSWTIRNDGTRFRNAIA